jgi:hypothetical protein
MRRPRAPDVTSSPYTAVIAVVYTTMQPQFPRRVGYATFWAWVASLGRKAQGTELGRFVGEPPRLRFLGTTSEPGLINMCQRGQAVASRLKLLQQQSRSDNLATSARPWLSCSACRLSSPLQPPKLPQTRHHQAQGSHLGPCHSHVSERTTW